VSLPVPPTIERPAPDPPPRRRLGALILVVAALVAGVTVAVIGLDGPDRMPAPAAPPPGFEVPELDVAPGASVPTATAVAPGSTTSSVSAWATRLSEKTEIPKRSLIAYAEAEIRVGVTDPDCNISWATLAGVGRVESHHGRYGGSRIGTDGTLTPPIIGIPLDGSPGVRAIQDTDRGRLDGDLRWDRAVGAMQFLPTTWARWGVRAATDGAAPDPQDIDDAALSAARYLCASGGDLSSAEGWWEAVMTYNRSVAYGRDVFSGADAYAKAAAKL
jgi:membrane-bound lytic murein transglycosylase B